MITSIFRPQKVGNLARYGSKNDGGYLLPNNLKFDLLISFGLGDDWNFENELKSRGKIANFIVFDHSVSYSQLLKKVILSSKRIFKDPMNFIYRVRIFFRYIFSFFGTRHFKLKVVNIGKQENESSAFDILERYTNSEKTCILKVDIEGGEWQILEAILSFSQNIDALIIEFHDINDNMDEYRRFRDGLDSVYNLVHIHANNFSHIGSLGIPDVLEATFVKNSLTFAESDRDTLPIFDLDAPCAPRRPDFFWDFASGSVYLMTE